MENPLSSDSYTVKSRIIRAVHVGAPIIIVIICILIPVVFFKSRVFLEPNSFEFLRRWLSPPYIYLVLNVVIILIIASPSLLRFLLFVFNYLKEVKIAHCEGIITQPHEASKPSLTPSTAKNPTSGGHFYQDWQDVVHDQTRTYLSSPLEINAIDEPWPDISEPTSSMEAPNSFDGPEEVKGFKKVIKERVETDSSLSLSAKSDDDKSLESIWNTMKERNEVFSSPSLIGKNCNNLSNLNLDDDTLEGTWNTIMKEENKNASVLDEDQTLDVTWNAIKEKRETETVSPLSSVSFNESGRNNIPSRLISPRVPRQDASAAWHELRKSETFNETVSARQRAGMRRDPSLSLDDLNCRVESFIKNFNHQMLLQRQESEQRFLEMINSGG